MLGFKGCREKVVIGACAVVMAILAGCDATADENGETSESYVCASVSSTWWNQSFAERTESFHFTFYATPSAANIDAVVGLSFGAATTWSKLATIVRFNPDGYIDVRAGGAYRADVPYRYAAEVRYRFDVAVDLARHTYTVIVDTGGDQVAIARDYAFRSEQAGVTRLNNIASFVNPDTGPGYLYLCEPTISDGPYQPAACITPMAGEGFRNASIDPSTTVELVSFKATAGRDNMDGVIGVSNGPADDYNDFAASMRFYTNGLVEARDADAYRADVQVPYHVGQQFEVRFIIDIPSRTYSVFVRPEGEYDFIELARGYRFRTQQAGVARLDNVAMIVASGLGGLTRCEVYGAPNPPLIAVRDGTWDVQPLADGGALISDGAKTVKLDAGNVPRGTLAVGGKVTTDSAGNIYVASIANNSLTVRAYTSAFALRWTRSAGTSYSAVGDVVVNSAGQIMVSVGTNGDASQFKPGYVARFTSGGGYLEPLPLATGAAAGSTAIGLSTNHFVVAHPVSGGVEVQVWTYDGSLLRTRQIAGNFTISQIAIANDDSVVIGGNVNASTDFGNCIVYPYPGPVVYWSAYVTRLGSDLFPTACQRLSTEINGLSNIGTQFAVAITTRMEDVQYAETLVYKPDGTFVWGSDSSGVGKYGYGASVWLANNGRVFRNVDASLGESAEAHFPFLITMQP